MADTELTPEMIDKIAKEVAETLKQASDVKVSKTGLTGENWEIHYKTSLESKNWEISYKTN